MTDTVMVRVRSRRGAERLKQLVGVEKLDWYFNIREGNSFVLIPADLLDEARNITGVTRACPKHDLYKCWDYA